MPTNTSKNAFIIAAPSSGSGKTMLTLLLASYFKSKEKKVQCFKSGPDYLDASLHYKITGRSAINLDVVMMPEHYLKNTFEKYSRNVDFSIVEGMMGLFDGVQKTNGSTAHISKIFGLPVILVVSAKGVGFSVVALLKGLLNYDKNVTIKGVIFNEVNSERHQQLLRAAADEAGICCLGFLPFDSALKIPSRHLGLATETVLNPFFETAQKIENYINFDTLLKKTTVAVPLQKPIQPLKKTPHQKHTAQKIIAVARDEAFHFYYDENLHALKQIGKLMFFSPLKDDKIPDANFIYIGGGYPENHLERLSNNKPLQKSLQSHAQKGTKIWAECGGMMFLGKEIIDKNGNIYPMAHIFDFSTSMAKTRLQLGYRQFILKGQNYCGHEFHYSTLNISNTDEKLKMTIKNIQGEKTDTSMFRFQNTLASYVHLYWGDAPFKFINLF